MAVARRDSLLSTCYIAAGGETSSKGMEATILLYNEPYSRAKCARVYVHLYTLIRTNEVRNTACILAVCTDQSADCGSRATIIATVYECSKQETGGGSFALDATLMYVCAAKNVL